MGEAFIVRRGGVSSEETAAPTITIVSETNELTFTLTNNDDNTALITFEIDDQIGGVELAAAAVSANITVALDGGTYTLTAFATVVGEVASQSTAAVEIVVIPEYEELFELDVTTATTEIDITGLSIGKDDGLKLVFTFIGDDATSAATYSLFPNNLTTTSNYNFQVLAGVASSTVAARVNGNRVCNARSNRKAAGYADIKVSNNNRFVSQSHWVESSGAQSSALNLVNDNMVGNETVTFITSLKIVSSRTNGIAIGSKIALYKVTEAA